MIPQQNDSFGERSKSDTFKNPSVESTNKNSRAVMRLLADTQELLGVAYSDEEFKQTFTVIKSAKTRGFLGVHKSFDICLVECVNIANEILRSRTTEQVELVDAFKKPKSLYVYVSLVAVGLIPA